MGDICSRQQIQTLKAAVYWFWLINKGVHYPTRGSCWQPLYNSARVPCKVTQSSSWVVQQKQNKGLCPALVGYRHTEITQQHTQTQRQTTGRGHSQDSLQGRQGFRLMQQTDRGQKIQRIQIWSWPWLSNSKGKCFYFFRSCDTFASLVIRG